ncbi:DUF3822 family protein [Sabulilitoribacter multivorans]|uniref:DUF3822 family protein n=1 Tax=Flaviramulus multivorans TaxID=1304750 RepID=A0ABS9IJ79_9FLAO|nr:DUF3822 family protein [Flaviramulus multivorans]MCF7560654.1 DUF3822 family protein [Flaviramulus multivorans]
MALQNKSSNKLTNLKLSIQISLSGLSFCILNSNDNTITFLKEIHFSKNLNPLQILDNLKAEFSKEKALSGPFSEVCVVHDNDISALVPKPLFKEDCLADYLKFNSKILKSDFITYDELLVNDSVNIYVPYINVNNFIYDKFGAFTYKHVSTILIENILLLEKHSETVKVYVNVSKNHFEIIIVDKAKLLLYNTFKYQTKEDFIYFILFTAEQLELNPETFNLIFLGDITKNDELYKIAYTYIRNISFSDRQDSYTFEDKPKSSYSNFALIKSF